MIPGSSWLAGVETVLDGLSSAELDPAAGAWRARAGPSLPRDAAQADALPALRRRRHAPVHDGDNLSLKEARRPAHGPSVPRRRHRSSWTGPQLQVKLMKNHLTQHNALPLRCQICIIR